MRQITQSWRDENSKDRFPFDDGSNLVSVEGLQLPTQLIIDAAIHPAGLTGFAFLESIEVRDGKATFSVSDQSSAVQCTGTWPLFYASDQSVVPLEDQRGRPAGLLVLNVQQAQQLLNEGDRQFTFERRSARFVPFVIEHVQEPITNQITEDVVLPPDGDVYLVGEQGVILTCLSLQEWVDGELIPVTIVRVNAVGSALSKRERCSNAGFETPRFIREIVYQVGGTTHRCLPSGIGESFLVGMDPDGGETALRVQSTGESIELNFADGKDD